jgi:lipoate-protein ligase A
MNNNFSTIIQSFMMNEVNKIIDKYNNIEKEKLENVEALISKIDNEELRQELLQDFDKTLKLSIEIGNKAVDNIIVRAYLWIKKNSEVEISINQYKSDN